MKQLWRTLANQGKGIPSEIIFNALPKLDHEGFRWAPSTLLRAFAGSSMTSHATPGSYGKVEKKGFVASFVGATLEMSPEPSPGLQTYRWPCLSDGADALYIRDPKGGWAQLYSLRKERGKSIIETLRQHREGLSAVIIQSYRLPHQWLGGNSCSGILVQSQPANDGNLVWRRKLPVVVENLNNATWPAFDAVLSTASKVENNPLMKRIIMLANTENLQEPGLEELNTLHNRLQDQFISASDHLASIDKIADAAAAILPVSASDSLFRLLVRFVFRQYGNFKSWSRRQWCID